MTDGTTEITLTLPAVTEADRLHAVLGIMEQHLARMAGEERRLGHEYAAEGRTGRSVAAHERAYAYDAALAYLHGLMAGGSGAGA